MISKAVLIQFSTVLILVLKQGKNVGGINTDINLNTICKLYQYNF